MEAEERPSKLRKLKHDLESSDDASLQAQGAFEDDQTDTADALVVTSKNSNDATNDIDSSQDGDTVPNPTNQEVSPEVPMSKNQLKKLRRKQEWDAGREYRKAKKKEKLVEKRARKREAREKEEAEHEANGTLAEITKPIYQKPTRLPVAFVVDCGFDQLMMEKERISLGSQLTRCYSDNSRAPFQAHLIVSSWGGLLRQRFDTVLGKHYKNWKGVRFMQGDFMEAASVAQHTMNGGKGGKMAGAFEKYASTAKDGVDNPVIHSAEEGHESVEEKQQDPPTKGESNGENGHTVADQGEIVYLTSESEYTLEELKPNSVYIIGGLVDKNRHKGICYKTACERGIKTAKLPIGQYMEMQSRYVLATNHVVEIMVRWLECGDWGEAFMKVIPKRKGGKLKGDDSEDQGDESQLASPKEAELSQSL